MVTTNRACGLVFDVSFTIYFVLFFLADEHLNFELSENPRQLECGFFLQTA